MPKRKPKPAQECSLCEKGFPLNEDGNHIPTQSLGMIPLTRCRKLLAQEPWTEDSMWEMWHKESSIDANLRVIRAAHNAALAAERDLREAAESWRRMHLDAVNQLADEQEKLRKTKKYLDDERLRLGQIIEQLREQVKEAEAGELNEAKKAAVWKETAERYQKQYREAKNL